ncbi:hypothetical protein, partial [Mesorhizobium sp.]|uniref:hypothetical protein n=1 Tax=Mesorhizobium sp. TaxID=1871066 RepID=UPI0025D3E86C
MGLDVEYGKLVGACPSRGFDRPVYGVLPDRAYLSACGASQIRLALFLIAGRISCRPAAPTSPLKTP